METLELKGMSREQKLLLFVEMKKEEKAEEAMKKAERQMYKKMVSELINESIKPLLAVSEELGNLKMRVFQQFETLMTIKAELYGIKEDQGSHTFSNEQQTAKIRIGQRKNDAYDDTVNTGLAMVREFMETLAKDEKSTKYIKIINNFLKKDKDGNLKSNRVMELQKIIGDFADEPEIEELKEGIKIIVAAYVPQRSVFFVEAEVRNGLGAWGSVPLSVSAANFPDGYDFKF